MRNIEISRFDMQNSVQEWQAFTTPQLVFVWQTDLLRQQAFRLLSDTYFYAKWDKDLNQANQRNFKETIHNLITKIKKSNLKKK